MPLPAPGTDRGSVGGEGGDVSEMEGCLQVSVVQKSALLVLLPEKLLGKTVLLDPRLKIGLSCLLAKLLPDLGVANGTFVQIPVLLQGVTAEGAFPSLGVRVGHAAQQDLLESSEGVDVEEAQVDHVLLAVLLGVYKQVFIRRHRLANLCQLLRRDRFLLSQHQADGIGDILLKTEGQKIQVVDPSALHRQPPILEARRGTKILKIKPLLLREGHGEGI